MKRLVIIGNGFDRAHGLPTSYGDFFTWYFNGLIYANYSHGVYNYEDSILTYSKNNHPITQCTSWNNFLYYFEHSHMGKYSIKNKFFIHASCQGGSNWADIELYYKSELKKAFHSTQNKEAKIAELNNDFEGTRELFFDYLMQVVAPIETNIPLNPAIKEILLNWKQGTNFQKGVFDKLPINVRKAMNTATREPYAFSVEGAPTVSFLNFNYTRLLNRYLESHTNNNLIIPIHGVYMSNEESDEIVFGYGDENDDLFQALEDENVNWYLDYTKSRDYLHSPHYTRLLNFIEGDEFFVEVIGHSMAISDRTLLKAIFENPNCKYIFLWYYTRADGTDDFTDKALNIGRHFSDKKEMRKKVAPRVFCMEIPQINKNPL